jgi:hypothetical protein
MNILNLSDDTVYIECNGKDYTQDRERLKPGKQMKLPPDCTDIILR